MCLRAVISSRTRGRLCAGGAFSGTGGLRGPPGIVGDIDESLAYDPYEVTEHFFHSERY